MVERILKLALIVLIPASLNGCMVKEETFGSCGFVVNVYGERISWGAGNTVVLHLDPRFPAHLQKSVFRAADAWNEAAGYKILDIRTMMVSSPVQTTSNGFNTIHFLNTWFEGRNFQEHGFTRLYWNYEKIFESDVFINGQTFAYYTNENPIANAVNMDALMIHEFGHVLGLAHSNNEGSTMQALLGSNEDRIEISEKDADSIACAYSSL